MTAPVYLSDLAKQIYEQTAQAFPDIQSGDPDLLTSYSQVSALCEEMNTIIQRDGLVTTNARGYPAANQLLNPLKGYLREKANLSEKIRKRFKPRAEVEQDSDFA